jgi:hypothetical protein
MLCYKATFKGLKQYKYCRASINSTDKKSSKSGLVTEPWSNAFTLYICSYICAILRFSGGKDELEWEVERLEAAPLPPPLRQHRPLSSPLVIGDLLRYTPRGDCLSIVQVLIPSIKPFILLLPTRQIVLIRKESCPVVWPRILDAEWLPWEELLSACPRLEPYSDFGCNAIIRARYHEIRKATDL